MNRKISSKKKAAAVMIALGSDYASDIYKCMREEEVEQLTIEIASIDDLSAESIEFVIEEFYNLCLTQKVLGEGGIDYAKEVLNKAYGAHNAAALMDKVTKTLKSRTFDFLKRADPKHLLTFIQNEHPQTIALILSYLRTEQSSEIIAELPRETQLDVVERIATMDRTSPDFVREVEKTLEKKFSSSMQVGLDEIGGIKHIADILNEVDRKTEKFILEELSKKEPNLAEEIRQRMFIFEDIVTLDEVAIQRFLREVDTKDLIIALKGASKDVSDAFYTNMSSRMAEIMREEEKYMGAKRLVEVEEAQQKLVGVVRKMEESGEIYIARGRKDEIIA